MADSLNKKKTIRPYEDESPAAKGETVTVSDIEKLFSLMRENDIAELEIEQYKTKIHIVSKGTPANQPQMVQYMPAQMPMMPMQSQQQPAPQEAGQAQSAAPAKQPASAEGAGAEVGDSLPPNARTVLSPMVGTFYRSPSPEAPSFVHEGDVVNEETVLCIIEAMKLMNEIKAETRGKILRVLVENGMPVEFNQPLFVLES